MSNTDLACHTRFSCLLKQKVQTILPRSISIFALIGATWGLWGCGPEKSSNLPEKNDNRNSEASQTESNSGENVNNDKNEDSSTDSNNEGMAKNLEGALMLRSFDFEEADRVNNEGGKRQVVFAATERTCDDESKKELGITTVFKKWSGTQGNVTFLDSLGFPNTRLETWIRPALIPCSSENWAKVGWQSAKNLENLEQRVLVQLAVSRKSGNRSTESVTFGQRSYTYQSAGYSLLEDSVTFRRTVVIGSKEIPTTVRVVLKENENEIRRTSGDIYTDPMNPIVELVTRSIDSSGEDKSSAPLTLAKKVESGVIFSKQADGTQMKTTLKNLVYLGRKKDGTFSCVPTQGSVTDELTFPGKGEIKVTREASPNGSVLSTTCSVGLSIEECSALVQKSLRTALTPYCLY